MKKLTLLFAAIASLTTGCAQVNLAKEKTFAEAKSGYGIIYFYRESHYAGGATSYNIWNNDTKPPVKIGALGNGTYFYMYEKPGHHQYVVNGEVQGSADFDVEAGKTYYIQNRIDFGFWAARPKLVEVTKNEGEKQIRDPELKMTTLEAQAEAPANSAQK